MADTDILSEIRDAQHRPGGCTLGKVLATLPDEDRAGLIKALDDPGITGTAIASVLQRRGLRIQTHTVQRHRAKRCCCDG